MTCPQFQRWLGVLLIVSTTMTVGWQFRGRGYKASVLNYVFPPHPAVRWTRPSDAQTDIDPGIFIAADVSLPNVGHGVDTNSLSTKTVRLFRADNNETVAAVVNTSGGGDAIVLQPMEALSPLTQYTFEVTPGVRDTGGMPFRPYRATFTTGEDRAVSDFPGGFEKVPLTDATSGLPTIGLTVGPDHRLYATTVDGRIFRFDISADGTLRNSKLINTIFLSNGWSPRMVPGIKFDPASTPDNLIAWVTHSQFSFDSGEDWTGKLARLSGPNLEKYQDYVVGLPRSVRDHITATPEFGPDGAIYFGQPSNSAMGAPDAGWGKRPERLLSAAILRFDPKLAKKLPLDVRTEGDDLSRPYDPAAPDAPLTIYATGVRNAFDVVFHSNGTMYAPVNGSAAGGATPGYTGGPTQGFRFDGERGTYDLPPVPELPNVPQTQSDMLQRIVKGGYYGHPNPTRNEYVMNAGNPSAGADKGEVWLYPVGTQPDRNYHPFVYDFGQNVSPNGIIEYQGGAFGGALKGKLLVTRYSGGKDIVALELNEEGNVEREHRGIIGFSQLVSPIGIVEDRTNGNLYVAEFGGMRISLLRPLAPGVHASPSTTRMLFNDVVDSSPTVPQKLSIRNVGTELLQIDPEQIWFAGPDAHLFTITVPPTATVAKQGRSVDLLIAFNPTSTADLGVRKATLSIATNDPAKPSIDIALRGLATAGDRGANEPSLQRILDLYELPINVGDPDPATADLGYAPVEPNDEVQVQQLQKALPDPVTIEPLAAFGPSSASPMMALAWYDVNKPEAPNSLFTIEPSDSQSVNLAPVGSRSFDPGEDLTFGLASTWTAFDNRVVATQQSRNTYTTGVGTKGVRFYPLKNAKGTVVPFAYVFTIEAVGDSADAQDFVGIIRNVKPVRAR